MYTDVGNEQDNSAGIRLMLSAVPPGYCIGCLAEDDRESDLPRDEIKKRLRRIFETDYLEEFSEGGISEGGIYDDGFEDWLEENGRKDSKESREAFRREKADEQLKALDTVVLPSDEVLLHLPSTRYSELIAERKFEKPGGFSALDLFVCIEEHYSNPFSEKELKTITELFEDGEIEDNWGYVEEEILDDPDELIEEIDGRKVLRAPEHLVSKILQMNPELAVGVVEVLEVPTLKSILKITGAKRDSPIAVAWSDDSRLFAVGAGREIHLFREEDGKFRECSRCQIPYTVHLIGITSSQKPVCHCSVWDADERRTALVAVDPATGEVLRKIAYPDCERGEAFTRDARLIAATAVETVVMETETGKQILNVTVEEPRDEKTYLPRKESPSSAAFSADGRYLAVGMASSRVIVWDLTSGEIAADFTCGEKSRSGGVRRIQWLDAEDAAGAFECTGIFDGVYRIELKKKAEEETRFELKQLDENTDRGSQWSLAFLEGEKYIASADTATNHLRLAPAGTAPPDSRRKEKEYLTEPEEINFSPSNRYLAVATSRPQTNMDVHNIIADALDRGIDLNLPKPRTKKLPLRVNIMGDRCFFEGLDPLDEEGSIPEFELSLGS